MPDLSDCQGIPSDCTVHYLANEPEQTGMAHLSATGGELWLLGGSMSTKGSLGVLARIKRDQWLEYGFSDAYVFDVVQLAEGNLLACGSKVLEGKSRQTVRI